MTFLDDVITPRETSGNIPSPSPERESQSFLEESRSYETDETDYADEEHCEYASSGPIELEDRHPEEQEKRTDSEKRKRCFEQPERRNRRERKKTLEEKALALEKRKIQILESRQQNKKFNESDDDYMFLRSRLPSIKRLDELEKMMLRMEILSSVTRAVEKKKYGETLVQSESSTLIQMPSRQSSTSTYSSHQRTPTGSPGNFSRNSMQQMESSCTPPEGGAWSGSHGPSDHHTFHPLGHQFNP